MEQIEQISKALASHNGESMNYKPFVTWGVGVNPANDRANYFASWGLWNSPNTGYNLKVFIGGTLKVVTAIKVFIGGTLKTVTGVKAYIGGVLKSL